MVHDLLRLTHLFGIIMWIGGAAALGLAAAFLEDKHLDVLRKTSQHIVVPGMLLAWGAGLGMLIPYWSQYSKSGWMHTKPVTGLIVAGLTGMLTAGFKKDKGGKRARILAAVILLLALSNAALAILRPF